MNNVQQTVTGLDLSFLEYTPEMHGCMWCNNRRTATDEEFKATGLSTKCLEGIKIHGGILFPMIHSCPNWTRSPWCDYKEYREQGGKKSYFQWKASR